jgi:hypothetical protein
MIKIPGFWPLIDPDDPDLPIDFWSYGDNKPHPEQVSPAQWRRFWRKKAIQRGMITEFSKPRPGWWRE